MGKAEEEQNPVSNTGAQADGNPNSQTRFGCRCARIRRLIGLKCIFILLLSIAVFLSAIFWLPPFLQFADQADLDLDSKFKDHGIVATFNLLKPVSLLEDNILQLEDDVFDELGSVASTKVVVLSLEPFKGSNETTVIFAVDPEAKYSKLSEAAESLIRGSFEIFFTRLPLFHLTPSLFGEPKSFDVLKFPGGITIIPQQNAFLLQKVQFYFNFTLNFSIHQIQANFKDLTSQLKLGLHLAPYENLYVNLSNSKGSTISAPTVVQSSVLLTVGNTNQRMKQLAQTITGSHSKNLGLNNTVFGKVKQVRLSSIMQQYLHGGDSSASASSPSPAPFSHAHHHHHHRHHHHHHHHHSAHLAPAISPVPASQKGSPATQKGVPAPEDGAPTPAESSHEKNYEAKPPGCRFRYRSKGEERKRLHLAPAVAPAKPNVSLHHPSASPHKQVAPPKHTPNSVPVSSPLPSVVFAHTQPPSKSKPDNEHFDSRPVIAPIPPTSDAGSGSPPTVQLVLSLLLTLVLHL
ncbi:hypothetical protein CsatB_018946 [Cannabis sativa]|uniref:uncharacterized protein LOC115699367 n=1 Tax=Cannabis sativa TaxID=3483 RepID=UPI0029CA9C01|nr:uncharacterized protein LOC115699367 [Cannabis sativa]